MTELQRTLDLAWPVLFHVATILGALLALLLISQILRSPRMPAATMGWLFAIILVPFIGIPLYLTFGTRKLNMQFSRKAPLVLPCRPCMDHHSVNHLLVSLGIPSSSDGNLVHFHGDASVACEELFTMLDSAQRTIDVAIFILSDDHIGHEILSRLEHKAAQGVAVRLLLDGVGSFKLPKELLQPLASHDGEVAWFIPVLHRPLRGKTNMRNHRKIVIADHEKVWTGGRNFSSLYLGIDENNNGWIDLSFYLQGPVVSTYCEIFEADWHFVANRYQLS